MCASGDLWAALLCASFVCSGVEGAAFGRENLALPEPASAPVASLQHAIIHQLLDGVIKVHIQIMHGLPSPLQVYHALPASLLHKSGTDFHIYIRLPLHTTCKHKQNLPIYDAWCVWTCGCNSTQAAEHAGMISRSCFRSTQWRGDCSCRETPVSSHTAGCTAAHQSSTARA